MSDINPGLDEVDIRDLTMPPANIVEPELPGEVQEPEVIPDTPPEAPPPTISDEQLDQIAFRSAEMITAHEMVVRLLTPIFDEPSSPSKDIARNLTKILINHSRSIVVEDLQRRIIKIVNEREKK